MKKTILILIFAFVYSTTSSQNYLLNIDFNGTTSNTPPAGWTNTTITGAASDKWSFNNPGGRSFGNLFLPPFAIFDAEHYSAANGPEISELTSNIVDATGTVACYLQFHTFFHPHSTAKGLVQVFNGNIWVTVDTVKNTNGVIVFKNIDVSSHISGVSNSRVRFRWEGNGFGYWAIDNVKVFAPLFLDGAITNISSPTMPLTAGSHSVKVRLENHGHQNLSSTTINWSVNSVLQTPYNWTGNLAFTSGQDSIQIGSYNFPSGGNFVLKVWQSNPNNGLDFNSYNDTVTKILQTPNVYNSLCGTYTIGGANPDFNDFTTVINTLENAGVTCPVVFNVRNGTYNEQLHLKDFLGMSPINTVTFQSQAGDSNSVNLTYQNFSPSNDFTIFFDKAAYFKFRKMKIDRLNGNYNIVIANNSHNITLENNILGYVFSPNTSCDSVIKIKNNIITSTISIDNPITNRGKDVEISNNRIDRISINNVNNLKVDSNYKDFYDVWYGFHFISNCSNISYCNNVLNVNLNYNGNFIRILDCNNLTFQNNKIQYRPNWYDNTEFILLKGNTLVDFSNNNIFLMQDWSYNSINLVTFQESDFTLIKGNQFKGVHPSGGKLLTALALNNNFSNLSLIENQIDYVNYGITLNNANSTTQLINNTINSTIDHAILISGQLAQVHQNKINNCQKFGIINDCNNAKITNNKVFNFSEGVAVLNNKTAYIINNFIHCGGLSRSIGITNNSTATNSNIVYNSINITSTDSVNGIAMQIYGGSGLNIQNNIFANTSRGIALEVNTLPTSSVINRNGYYHNKYNSLVKLNGVRYDTLSLWRSVSNFDLNSLVANPFYLSDTNLIVSQQLYNNSAYPIAGIVNDIDGVLRNSVNPDFGAKEFDLCSVDAGINKIKNLKSPLNTGSTPITVVLHNHGTNVLTSVSINWKVDGVAQASYSWLGSLASGQSLDVNIGSFNFLSGNTYTIEVFTSNPNGTVDCKPQNDKSVLYELSTQLCGVYTIGGVTSNFNSFADAANALNSAGIACPVRFIVRPGVYFEQILIGDIIGSSPINTITFESQNADSSSTGMKYQQQNNANDFVLSLSGTKYITFKNLFFERFEGFNSSIIISNNSHNVSFLNCKLHSVFSPSSSYDSVLVFKNCNIYPNQISISQPANTEKTILILDSCMVKKVIMDNLNDVLIANSIITNYLPSNIVHVNEGLEQIKINSCKKVKIFNSSVLSAVHSGFVNSLSIENSSNIDIHKNLLTHSIIHSWSWGYNSFMYFNQNDTLKIRNNKFENFIGNVWDHKEVFAIRAINSSNVEIDSNILENGNLLNYYYHGIYVNNIQQSLRINANRIINYNNSLICEGLIPSSIILNNEIKKSKNISVLLKGSGGVFQNNLIDSTMLGNSIKNESSNILIHSNRISNTYNGTGIHNIGSNVSFYNNYIHSPQTSGDNGGLEVAAGNNVKIYHNNINSFGFGTGNGNSLKITAGSNIEIKNNIFSSETEASCVFISPSVSSVVSDYNSYFTKGNIVFFRDNQNYNLNTWRTAFNQDLNSVFEYPFYKSNKNLHPTNSGFIDVATPIALVTTDIDGTPRVLPDIGAKEDVICPNDAGVLKAESFGVINVSGNKDVKVYIKNHGNTPITTLTINYSVNNQIQTPFAWTGNILPMQTVLVTIGSFNFNVGQIYKFEYWTSLPNGIADCKNENDTFRLDNIKTPLCGTYTIGGVNPDFPNFNRAVNTMIENGISCSVEFLVREGEYNEKIVLTHIQGNSSQNTITFKADSGNATNTKVHFANTDITHDCTLLIDSVKYVYFENLGIIRSNGTYSVLFKNNPHNISFKNCSLGETSLFDNKSIKNISFYGSDFNNKRIIFCNSLSTENDSISIKKCQNIQVISLKNTSNILIDSCVFNVVTNWDYWINQNNFTNNVKILNSKNIQISNNSVSLWEAYWRSMFYLESINNYSIKNNLIGFRSYYEYNPKISGVEIKNSINGVINENQITVIHIGWSRERNGIYIEQSDSTIIFKNFINQLNRNEESNAINIGLSCTNLLIDSNTIYNIFKGIVINSDSVRVLRNELYEIGNQAIFVNSKHNLINKNLIRNCTGADGVVLAKDSNEVSQNKVRHLSEGVSIRVNSKSNLIKNNFIHNDGFGLSEGINVGVGAKRNIITYNSFNNLSTDSIQGKVMVVNNGDSLFVKNNIFSNQGTGFCVVVNDTIKNGEWDYNVYFSSYNKIGKRNATSYNSLLTFSSVVLGDINSKFLNPYFQSNTELRPWRREINGSGVHSYNVYFDIDDQLRNTNAPDIGADEFRVDFGITEMLSPGLKCFREGIDTVTIHVRQFGDIPFKDMVLAYQVNGGQIYYDTIPGWTHNDFIHSFTTHINMSTNNVYNFKLWLVAANDDNKANDTLHVVRHSTPNPNVSFNYLYACFGDVTQFLSNATVVSPFTITDHLWKFSAVDSSLSMNPTFSYDTTGVFPVYYKVITDVGCYADTVLNVNIFHKPLADFTFNNVCLFDTVHFLNNSNVNSNDLLSYIWNFGNGNNSTIKDPFQIYLNANNYNVQMIVNTDKSCSDTIIKNVIVYPLPALNMQVVNIDCFNNTNGSINASASLASPPYTYLWNNNSTDSTLSGLTQGLYQVTVTDSHGCKSIDTASITSPPDIILNFTSSVFVCENEMNGWAKVSAIGGTLPYSYLWGNGQTTDSLLNVAFGSYSVTVTDNKSCSKNLSLTLNSQNKPLFNVLTNDVLCFGDSTAKAFTNIISGVAPYNYLWTTTPIQTQDTAFNLVVGNYNIILTDATNCKDTVSFVINQPDIIENQFTIKPISCYGFSDAEVNSIISGGVPPYSYSWNTVPVQTTSTLLNVPAGNYNVEVTDSNNCESVFAINIQNPDTIVMSFSVTNETCLGACDGKIISTIIGGAKPYSYIWDTNPIQNTKDLENLCVDVYTLELTDSLNCKVYSPPLTINPGLTLTADYEYSPLILYDGMSANFNYTGTNANGFYWDFDNGQTSSLQNPTNIQFGAGAWNVQLIVTLGANDICADTITKIIQVRETPKVTVSNVFTPNNDSFNDTFFPDITEIEVISFTVFNRWGAEVYRSNKQDAAWDGTFKGEASSAGVYYWVLKYKNPKTNTEHELNGVVHLIR